MADDNNKPKTNPYVSTRPWLKPGERETIQKDSTGQNIMYPLTNRLGRPKTIETVNEDVMKHIAEYEKQKGRNKLIKKK